MPASRRGRRRRRPSPDDDRAARRRQNDAGPTPSGLLPPLSHSESLEVTAIHSVAGLLSGSTPLITRPPFVAPHHTSSVASLVGGGTGMARPGAVSRAHRGVLSFDECAEIGVSALEALRTPLEDGEIRLARRDGVARYPARFQLVLAANLCLVRRQIPAGLHLRTHGQAPIPRQAVGPAAGSGPTCASRCTRSEPVCSPPRRPSPRHASASGWRRPGWPRRSAGSRTAFTPTPRSGGALLRRKFRPVAAAMEPLRSALDPGLLSIRGVDRTLRVA